MIIKELRNNRSKFNQCQNLPFIDIIELSQKTGINVKLVSQNSSKKIYTVGNT
jgi:hypothetical protein